MTRKNEFLAARLRAELKPVDTLPQWALEHKHSFYFAPRELRRYLRLAGIWPSYYSVRVSRQGHHGKPVAPYVDCYVDCYVVWGPRLGWLKVFPDELLFAYSM